MDFSHPPICGGCLKQTCQHLHDPTGENEPIKCQSCRGNVKIKFPLHVCALHTICLPTYVGEHETMTCTKCKREKLGFEPKEI